MLKKSRSKKQAAEQSAAIREEKKSFRVRMRDDWNTAVSEMVDFKENSAKAFLKWLLVYFLIAFYSLFLSHADSQYHLSEFPTVLALLIPRMFTLFLFTCPVLNLKKRKSAFLLMTAFWLLWHCIAFDRVKRGSVIFVILFLISVLVYLAETPKTDGKYRSLFDRLTVMLLIVVAAVFALQIAQMKHLIKPFSVFFLSPDIFACNLLCFAVLGVWIFFVRRQKVAFCCYTVLWTTLAVISFCKSKNTFEPVLFLDVFSLREGTRALFAYYSWYFIAGACILIFLAVTGIIFLALKEKKKPFSFVKLLSGLLFAVIAFAGIYYMSRLNFLASESKTAKNEYDQKGFVYGFLFYSLDSFVVEPEGYTPTMIDQINQKLESEYVPYGEEASNVQNVIVIQLESFTDPYDFPGIVLEEDPMPFIRSLMNGYTSGYVDVPVFGGLTVKSEFEFMTGLSIENLPLGYNPYVQYLHTVPVDSFARSLKAKGFEATAIHNYQGEFFERHRVYKDLGFDYYIPYECMPDITKSPDKSVIWANDNVFVNHITQALDHNGDGKNFVFGVTVQMHGNYYPIPEEEYMMKIGGISNKETEGAMAYYIQQLRDVDDMVRDLIAALSERDEATYVLFYGDHLPSLFGSSTPELTNSQKYSTPYFTWNNMGIDKKETKSGVGANTVADIELFQLSTFLCHELKLDGTQVNRFHTIYSDSAKYAQEFSSIQYYKLYDEIHTADFGNPDYEIGLVPLTVTEIRSITQGSELMYEIKGTGFSDDTYICIDNKLVYQTELIDENTLLLKEYPDDPLDGSFFTVRIIGEKVATLLKESETYEWSALAQ